VLDDPIVLSITEAISQLHSGNRVQARERFEIIYGRRSRIIPCLSMFVYFTVPVGGADILVTKLLCCRLLANSYDRTSAPPDDVGRQRGLRFG
jgi:hypothetical protein